MNPVCFSRVGNNFQGEIKAFVPMRQRPLADHIDAFSQKQMESFRGDSSAGFQDNMWKFAFQPEGNGLEFVGMEIIQHDDVCACPGRLSSLFVVAGFDLGQETKCKRKWLGQRGSMLLEKDI